MKPAIVIGVIVVVLALGFVVWPATNNSSQSSTDAGPSGSALVKVVLPEEFSQNAQIGMNGFEAKCAVCHGANAAGQDGVAPPLIHIIYEPNHHGDESFQRAAVQGVPSHHWPFGNMPAVEGVTRSDVTMIIAYIRELQSANGIN